MEPGLGFVIVILAGLFGLWVGYSGEREAGYREGQIDALNGKVKYEKKENEDGETVWTEID